MAELNALLPAPKRTYEVLSTWPQGSTALTVSGGSSSSRASGGPPPYGKRAGWLPRSQADFGDGGAFPELLVAQYPLDMGRPGKALSTAVVPVAVDAGSGGARFDAIVTAQHGDKAKVHSRFGDLVEKGSGSSGGGAGSLVRARPSGEEEAAAAAKTAAALQAIVDHKMDTARAGYVNPNALSRAEQSTYVRYTPAADTAGFTEGISQRVIRMVEAPVDPFAPAKFKHKKLPGGPPDAPVPIMHSPPRKLTAEDQAAWEIPTAVSNWQNRNGFIVPLDKRVAADGRSLLEPEVNDKFAKFSEALLIAERKARVEVETRAAITRKLAHKEREEKEAALREMAARARMERAGIAPLPPQQQQQQSSSSSFGSSLGSASGAGAGAGYGGFDGGLGGGHAAAQPSAGAASGSASGAAAAVARPGGLLGDDYGDAEALDDGGAGADHAGSGSGAGAGGAGGAGDADGGLGRAERDRLRDERRRERERELRAEESARPGGPGGPGGGGTKRQRTMRPGEDDRDISEKVALGLPVGRGAGAAAGEALFDSRLFNQSEGLSSGFGGEDEYNVYSKAWRSDTAASSIYKPRPGGGLVAGGGELSAEEAEAQVRALSSGAASRFGKGVLSGGGAGEGEDFEGVSKGRGGGKGGGGGGYVAGSGGPIQFERYDGSSASAASDSAGAGAGAATTDDPFGLDQFLVSGRSSGGAGAGGSSSGGAAPRGNALDRIGKSAGGGFMAAAGGGAFTRGADGSYDRAGSGRSGISFAPGATEGGSSGQGGYSRR